MGRLFAHVSLSVKMTMASASIVRSSAYRVGALTSVPPPRNDFNEKATKERRRTEKGRGCALVLAPRVPSHVSHVDSILWSENRTSLRASPLVGSVRCRRMQKRCSAGASIDAGGCKHAQASMLASMQANASIRKHRCRSDAARVQERCSTGAARVQERCRSDAASMQKGRMQALHRCYACIASRCMQAKAALTAQASAICLQYACIVCISLNRESPHGAAGKGG